MSAHLGWRAARIHLAFMGTVALLVGACGGGAVAPTATAAVTQAPTAAAATATAKPAPDKVTFITDFLLWGWHSPFFAAKAEGFFAEQSLDVTIQAGKGSVDTGTALGTGAAQIGLIDISTAVLGMSKGTDIKLVGVYAQSHPGGLLYIKERTSIKTWKDIEGKKIGGATGDAYLVALPGLMKQNAADPSKYALVTIEAAATTGALIAGQVDAIPGSPMTAPPRQDAAAKEKLTLERFSFADNGYKAVGFAIGVNGKLLKENPGLVQRFVNAWAKATVWSIANPDKAVADFIAANPDKNKDQETRSFNSAVPLIKGTGTLFRFDADRIKLNVDFVNAEYAGKVKADDVYTNDFVQKLPAAYLQGKLP